MSQTFNRIKEVVANPTTLMIALGCVYLFALWSLLPLLFPIAQGVVFYIILLQLGLLPLGVIYQNLLHRNSERRNKQDHHTIMGILVELRALMVETVMARRLAPEVPDESPNEIVERLARIEKLMKPVKKPRPKTI